MRVRREQDAVPEGVELMIGERAVKPVRERRIFDPRMLRAHVIGDLILNDFQAERMRLVDELAQGCEVAETIVNCEVIDRVITVVVSVRAPRLVATVNAVPVVVPRS